MFDEDVTTVPTHQRARSGASRTYQVTQLAGEFTALDNVLLAVNARERHNFRFWRTHTTAPLRWRRRPPRSPR